MEEREGEERWWNKKQRGGGSGEERVGRGEGYGEGGKRWERYKRGVRGEPGGGEGCVEGEREVGRA